VLVDTGLHDHILASLVKLAIVRKIQHHSLVCDCHPVTYPPQCDDFLNLCKDSELWDPRW